MSNAAPNEALTPWSKNELRELTFDPTTSTVCARNLGLLQRLYPFSSSSQPLLKLRYSAGFPLLQSLSGYLWVMTHDEQGDEVEIAIDPSYVFDRTACYVPQKVLNWGGEGLIPMASIVEASISELTALLNLNIQGVCLPVEFKPEHVKSHLALDYRHENKVILLGKTSVINRLEENIRAYSSEYWEDFRTMGTLVKIKGHLHLSPVKALWNVDELGALDVGDLIAIENFHRNTETVQLRGHFTTADKTRHSNHRLEVFLQMNQDDTQLFFGSDEQTHSGEENYPPPAPRNEEIELELYAGSTTVSFNDLCAVQAGTLIELRDHSLPFVKLCVMGSPILEGELVNFQDQVMIQITKRLD